MKCFANTLQKIINSAFNLLGNHVASTMDHYSYLSIGALSSNARFFIEWE